MIALMVNYNSLTQPQLRMLASRGDAGARRFLTFAAAKPKPPEPEHTPGRSERDRDHVRIARQSKTWQREDDSLAKERARILYNLGLTPGPAPSSRALASAEKFVRMALEGGSEKILHSLRPHGAWHGPACLCGQCD